MHYSYWFWVSIKNVFFYFLVRNCVRVEKRVRLSIFATANEFSGKWVHKAIKKMPRHPARGLICLVCCLNCSRKSLKVRKRSRLLPRQASEFKLMFRVIRRRGKQFRASHLFTFSMPRFGILQISYSNCNKWGRRKENGIAKKDCKITQRCFAAAW